MFGFLAALVGLIAIGLFLHRSVQEVNDVSNRRGDVRQANYQIKSLIVLLADAETGQRGYLLTGRDKYLAPYKKALTAIPKIIVDLQTRLGKQPDQIERLQTVGFLIDEKLAELASTIKLRRERGLAAAMKVVETDRGQDYMDELRDITREMDAEQKLQIAVRNEIMAHIVSESSRVVFFGSGFAVLVLSLCMLLLGRNQRRRLDSETSLRNSNALLEKERALLSKVVMTQNKIGTAALNSNTIMELVVKYSMELTASDGATIELIEGQDLYCRYTGGNAHQFLGAKINLHKSLSAECLRENRGIISDDTEVDPRVDRERTRAANARSIAVVPLLHGNKTIGILKNFSASAHHFDAARFNALTLVTGLLASALAQASEFEEKLTAVIDLEKTKLDLIESRDQAEAATQAKSRFLANMSHELRTPLNGILGMTGLLSEGSLNAQQREYADAIKISGQSLLRLVSDILDFSKIEAGHLEFEQVDFDLTSTLQDVIKSFGFNVRQKDLKLSMSTLPDLPAYINGDPGRIRQILVNLINNAIKFTPKGAITLTVENLSTTDDDVYLKFAVKDSGIGIPADTVKNLFQEFTQADVSTTRRYGGTGLGLSICKRLSEQMGGAIGVETELGKGSTFWFTLHLKPGQKTLDSAVHPDIVELEIPSIDRPWRALIAEDNQFNQIIIVKMLEKLGVRGDIASNGKEAVDALQNRPYDLILMDCQMPEMDGYEATTFIRHSGLLQHSTIPIIAMTANAMKGDRENCLAAGMDDYLSKPLDIHQVRNLLLKWLPKDGTDSKAKAA